MKGVIMKKWVKVLITVALPFLVMGGIYCVMHSAWYKTNKACHEECKRQGYAAGEDELLYEHTVCVCFHKKAGPTGRFVLEVSDKLEDR